MVYELSVADRGSGAVLDAALVVKRRTPAEVALSLVTSSEQRTDLGLQSVLSGAAGQFATPDQVRM